MRAVLLALVVVLGQVLMTQPGAPQEAAQAPESAFLSEMFSDAPLDESRFDAAE